MQFHDRQYRRNRSALYRRAIAIAACTLAFVAVFVHVIPAMSFQSPNEAWKIDGVVQDALTNEPIRDVRIQIRALNQETTTDKDGRFSLSGTRGVEGILLGEKPGYVGIRLAGRRVIGNVGIPISPVPGQQLVFNFRMFPAGVASGRVIDSRGDPIQGVGVVAMHEVYNEIGFRSQKSITSVKTNDIGEFRIGGLEDGDYVFKVEPVSLNLNADGKLYSATYYPGVPDVAKARLFSVESGSPIRLGDIVLDSPPENKVQIRAVSEDGAPVRGSIVIHSAGETSTIRSGILNDTGAIVALPQGTYDMTLSPAVNSTAPKSTQRVDLRSGNTELQLSIPRSAKLTGKVVLNSGDAASVSPVSRVQLQLLDPVLPFAGFLVNNLPAGVVSRMSDPGGVFSFPPFSAGKYQIYALGVPAGMYLAKTLDASGHDLMPDGINVVDNSNGAEVTVVLGKLSVNVEGKVTDENGRPIPNAVVAVLPDDRSQKHLTFSVNSDANGNFKLSCPAGSFHAYAWTELDGPAYRNVEFMKNYNDQGQAIRAEDGQSLSVHLRVLNP